jgi:hypothetical protein
MPVVTTESLTEVLDVLIGDELGQDSGNIALDTAGEVAFIHDNSVGDGSRDERQAIRESGPRRVVIEDDEGDGVAEDGEQQHEVSGIRSAIPAAGECVGDSRESTYPTNQPNLQRATVST